MNTLTRRTALAAGLAAAPLAAATRTAAADVGSGTLGDWSSYSRSISTPSIIERVVARDGIFLFGDSITVGTARELAYRVRPDGVIVAVNGWSARPTSPAVDELAAWVRDHGAPRRIVMATGSNDIFAPAVMAGQIDRTMRIAGPDRVVLWVNVQVARRSQPAAVQLADQRNTGWVNAQIAEATSRWPNLRVIEWAEFLAAKPFRLTAYLRDGVHTTTTGTAARNELIRRALLRA